jgi:hypothetical protein
MGSVVALYEALTNAQDERARARVIAAAFRRSQGYKRAVERRP